MGAEGKIDLNLPGVIDAIGRLFENIAGYYQTHPVIFWVAVGLTALFIWNRKRR